MLPESVSNSLLGRNKKKKTVTRIPTVPGQKSWGGRGRMRSQLSNFNASLLAPGGSTASLGSGTPQRPPRRRAQSVGNSAYGSSLALASSTPRGSLFNAVSPERGNAGKTREGRRRSQNKERRKQGLFLPSRRLWSFPPFCPDSGANFPMLHLS